MNYPLQHYIEVELELLADKAYEQVRAEIQKVCDENNWDFYSAYLTYFVRPEDPTNFDYAIGNEITEKILELVHWHDEKFGFPDSMYVGKKWYPQ